MLLPSGGGQKHASEDLLNEHLMTFNQYKDAKSLFDAITIRFGGNDATIKTQKTVLKQMYENFSAQITESLDFIFNRLQKIRNKSDLDKISIDDLYNNFKIVKQKVKRNAGPSSSSGSQSMAFVSTLSTNNKDDVSTVFGVNIASPQVSTTNLSDATVAKRFFQKTGKKITINESDTAGYDKAKVECFNCHKMGHFERECRVPRNQENKTKNQETTRRTVNVEYTSSKAMVAINEAGFDWSYRVDDEASTNMAFMAFLYSENGSLLNENIAVLKRDILIKDSKIAVLKSKLENISKEKDDIEIKIEKFENASQSLDKLIGSQITNKSKRILGYVSYNAVLPPHIGRFSPLRIDLSHTGLPEFAKPSVENYGVKPIEVVNQTSSVKVSKPVKENNDASLIEDWESEGDDEVKSSPEILRKTVEPSVDKARPVNPKPTRRSFQRRTTYNNRNFSQKVYTAKGKVNTARPNLVVLNAVRTNKGKPVKALALQDQGETSSRHVDSSNMHTFYQRFLFEHRWTKDHPLEQVIGNPSQPVRTTRQLESDAEMCMFALT
nr:ribonuclease H-like domain-containing protein [Tanacetum cinerariifolium]